MAIAILLLAACTDEFDKIVETQETETTEVATSQLVTHSTKEEYLAQFARILSKATFANIDLRRFLKEEALKQFDLNYDVLFINTRDKHIGNSTFYDILASYSSTDSIDNAIQNIPLLNIYLTNTPILGVHPEDMDITDREIPIAVSMSDSTRLYLNGQTIATLAKGEVPAFHVLVVNENSRVTIEEQTGLKRTTKQTFHFKSPTFNGETNNSLKSATTTEATVGNKVKTAYDYFHGTGHGADQKAFQRDYLYYGITPKNQSGKLNASMSEYLCYINVNPRAYFKMADVMPLEANQEDPICQNRYPSKEEDKKVIYNSKEIKKRKLTEAELVDYLWTKGAYELRFDIIDSKQGDANVIYVPVRPDEIWNFNITPSKRHKTWFRHTKYTYKIDPDKFTAKDYFIPTPIDMGKWNIANESMYRYIRVSEEDDGEEITDKYSYEVIRMSSHNFKGSAKLNVGFGDGQKNSASGEFSSETTKQNTTKEIREVSIKKSNNSDFLGKVAIYYYDPIVESTENGITLHTYTTGYVTFAVTAK